MNTGRTTAILMSIVVAVLAVAAPQRASAQMEVEADPIAYALNGFSLHLARVVGPLRVNVGTFGIDIPTFFHGNEGWSSSMRGAGVKVDFLGSDIDGFFAGVEGGYFRARYALDAASEAVKRDVYGTGVRGGYRLPIGGSGLYVVPWVGVSYYFNGDEIVVAGEEFTRGAIGVFPTVHIGWRF